MLHKQQRGFSTVEALLILVVAGLIGGAGWYVYQSKKEAGKSQDNSNKSSLEAPQQSAEEVKTTEDKFFEIKELGVKFKLTDRLEGLYYHIGNNGRTAYFSLSELKNTDCAADKTAQIALTKATETEMNEESIGDKMRQDSQMLDGYYYYVLGGQSGCSDDTSVQQKASELRGSVTDAVKGKLQVIN